MHQQHWLVSIFPLETSQCYKSQVNVRMHTCHISKNGLIQLLLVDVTKSLYFQLYVNSPSNPLHIIPQQCWFVSIVHFETSQHYKSQVNIRMYMYHISKNILIWLLLLDVTKSLYFQLYVNSTSNPQLCNTSRMSSQFTSSVLNSFNLCTKLSKFLPIFYYNQEGNLHKLAATYIKVSLGDLIILSIGLFVFIL